MDWVKDFYESSVRWWGEAESMVGDRDRRRVDLFHRLLGDTPKTILELGCGSATTAAAFAQAGHRVVGIDLVDRSKFPAPLVDRFALGALRVLKADFYEVDLGERFDAVTYWNGFGIGDDPDQRRLLRRVAAEWLADGGTALIDVFNPLVWAAWHGDVEHRPARPEAGYHHDLFERNGFDPVANRAELTWTDAADSQERFTQYLRCYSPADLRLLLESTGLRLHRIVAGEDSLDLAAVHTGHLPLLKEHYEYVAVLKPVDLPPADQR